MTVERKGDERSRSRRLLSDADVSLWHFNLAQGSELTADIYLRRLDMVCEQFNTDPAKLAGLDAKAAYGFLVEMVRYYSARGVAGSTVKSYVKAVRSWFTHSDIEINAHKRIRIRGAEKTPTLAEERVPEPHELNSVWKFCRPRQAAEIALLAFAGLRPEALGTYHGRDGLRLADLPELHYDNELGRVWFDPVPARLLVRDGLSKLGYAYETFLCREGCDQLIAYLFDRMREGEKLRPQSPLIAGYGSRSTVSTKTICEDVKDSFNRAGFKWRVYILRRYFDSRLDLASPEMGVKEGWIKFWMGHKGDIEALYRLQKKLSDSQLREMRAAYERASSLLQTIETQRSSDALQREFRAVALRSVGYTNEDLLGLDFNALTTEQFQELVSKKLNGASAARRQLVVTPADAERYINQDGWICVQTLATGKVVIETAGGPRP
jgi:hypothetical protein